MKKAESIIKGTDYPIYIGSGLYKYLKAYLNRDKYKDSKIFILVDENTRKYCLPVILEKCPILSKAEIIEIKSGEENKSLETASAIWTKLIVKGALINSLLINLGGGVICDIGGFVASTFKRGITYVNIPTTLLAQVDASIGGKTAIDFYGLKNQLGMFSNPNAVFIDKNFLTTLSLRELRSGYAEVIKHSLIRDKSYWELLTGNSRKEAQSWNPDQIKDWDDIIYRSLIIKNEIVKADPLDKKLRKKLNFGHTIGHAIESLSLKHDKNHLLHGEAVAIGMICEGYLSHIKLGLPLKQLNDIMSYINYVYQKYKFPFTGNQLPGYYDELITNMLSDKKNKSKAINFTLIKSIGSSQIDKTANTEEITESLEYYRVHSA